MIFANGTQNISYAIPQLVLVIRGRHILPKCYFRLGKWYGLFCNIFSPLAVAVLCVLFSFPATNPTTVDSMNYSSVVLIGLLAILAVLWLLVGKKFEGPKADLEKMHLIGTSGHGARFGA